jgi:hypothetical protein
VHLGLARAGGVEEALHGGGEMPGLERMSRWNVGSAGLG